MIKCDRAIGAAARSDWLRLAFIICLLNAPFWLLGTLIVSNRPLIGLDTLAVLLLAPISRSLALTGVVASWSIDALINQSRTYHFSSPSNFLASAPTFAEVGNLWPLLTPDRVMLAACFAAALAATALTLRATLRPRVILAAVLAIAALDTVNGSSMVALRSVMFVPVNVLGSGLLTLVVEMSRDSGPRALLPLPPEQAAGSAANVTAWASGHPQGSVLLVVVESWGLDRDTRRRSWLLGRLVDKEIERRFEVRELQLPFSGATTAAEIRALCNLQGRYRDLTAASANQCLPAMLTRLGWRTVGLHGFSAAMFDRDRWWPQIGIGRSVFLENLQNSALPRCGGAFRGICDADMVGLAMMQVATPSSFVYLLTLNSHLPLAKIGPWNDGADLSCDGPEEQHEVCDLVRAIGLGFTALRNGLKGLHDAPLVVIVGDHAPPFSRKDLRENFSADRVPAIVLMPRE